MENGAGVMFIFIVLIIVLGLIALMIISFWKIFEKAGQPGWAAIVPIYNLVIWSDIIKKPGWWALYMLIPYIGIIWQVWATNLLVKKFGKDEGFTVGCIFLPFVFWPILAFGDAKFQDAPIITDSRDVLDSDFVK
ncbi:MAG: hypothetical protein GC192_19755 [Bacteroidetes bacterium]|nr:hypothetical protein [Bacteroidota bacterium]